MDEVYIRTQDMAKWVAEKYFNNKDFITLDEFYRAFEDLSDDYDRLREDFDAVTCIPDGDEHEDYCYPAKLILSGVQRTKIVK